MTDYIHCLYSTLPWIHEIPRLGSRRYVGVLWRGIGEREGVRLGVLAAEFHPADVTRLARLSLCRSLSNQDAMAGTNKKCRDLDRAEA